METSTVTRADILAEAARRLRRHFGDRVTALFALPEDPYEPEDAESDYAIHLLLVLDASSDRSSDIEIASSLADLLNKEYAGNYLLLIRVITPDANLCVYPKGKASDYERRHSKEQLVAYGIV